MKKLLTLLVMSAFLFFAQHAHAQIVNSVSLSKTTLTNTDAATATLSVDKTVISVEVSVNKTSGTVSGSVKLQGSFDGTNWDDLDSLTLADQTLNRKVMAIPTPLKYPVYRISYATSGTMVVTASAKQLRRS